ncbi:MAG: hypothetical protein JF571_07875, partial [Asticcacaulis sp.]|nr:hypothetical protein [Asticcacaulis sp.]
MNRIVFSALSAVVLLSAAPALAGDAKPDIAALTKKAEAGDVAAERDLGIAYHKGEGAEEDDQK